MMVAAYIFLSVAAFAAGMLIFVRPVWCWLIRYTEKSESRAFQVRAPVYVYVRMWKGFAVVLCEGPGGGGPGPNLTHRIHIHRRS